ncbi:MAG: hypothetical protein AAF743_11520 [Planctomycetota bacterium]
MPDGEPQRETRPDVEPWIDRTWWRRMPVMVSVLLSIDLLLAGAYIVTRRLRDILGSDVVQLFDLDAEQNVPTWWSTIQLMWVSMLLLNFVDLQRRAGRHARWALIAAFGFAMLSLDEMVGLHERVAARYGSQLKVAALATAVPLLIGVFFVGRMALKDLTRDRRVLHLVIVGFAVYVLGFAVVDELGEFVERDTLLWRIEVLCEETLEMVGITILAWAAWLLVAVHRRKPV